MCDAVCSNTSEVHLARWFAAAMLAAAAAADARSQPCLPSHAVLDATLPLVPLPSHPRRQVCPGAAACKDCGQLPDQPRAVSVRQCVGGHVHGMIDVGQSAWGNWHGDANRVCTAPGRVEHHNRRPPALLHSTPVPSYVLPAWVRFSVCAARGMTLRTPRSVRRLRRRPTRRHRRRRWRASPPSLPR